MQVGAGHTFSTHIALNCNVATRLGLKELKSIEIGIYQASPCSHLLIGVKGRGRGDENAGGSRAPKSIHIVLNCNIGTRLGLKESKSMEIGIYQASPGSLCR